MLLSFMELLEQKKTAQPQEHPQEQDPRDDLLGHRRTQTDRKIMRNQPSSLSSVICVGTREEQATIGAGFQMRLILKT